MKRGFILLILITSSLFTTLTGQTESINVRAWIEKEEQFTNNKTEIRGMIKNESNREVTLYHRLELIRTGSNGTSRHQSNGSFTVAAKQKKVIARSSFYTKSAQAYQVNFRIFNDLGEIFSDSLVYPPASLSKGEQLARVSTKPTNALEKEETTQKKQQKNPIQNSSAAPKIVATPKAVTSVPVDVLEIDGLIIDETRSKIARDFYDLFYKKWIPPAGASNFSLFVREAPSRGRGARVSLSLNDQKIFENFVPPRYDALEEVVNFAIRIARNRLNTQKTINQQLHEEDQMGNGI